MRTGSGRRRSLIALAGAAMLIAAGCSSAATQAPPSIAPASAAPASVAPASAAPASAAPASATPVASTGTATTPLKVALVVPSAKNDLAFSESMVDGLNSLKDKYNLTITITDNAFDLTNAANALQNYAKQGYDLVIAHGSQYGAIVQQLAPQYPKVSFAWGTAGSTFNLPNVFAYQAASNEGGYVQGAMAALLSKSHKLGVIGPIAVGDAKLYVDGFVAGAKSIDPNINATPVYTGSFSDVSLMKASANAAVAKGADVLTGSSQSVVGAIGVANDKNLAWFGTQWSQSSLAPKNEVSAQIYDWTPSLIQIINLIHSGTLGGASFTISLSNGGEKIQYNSGYALPADVKAKADSIIADITSGKITPPQ